MLASAPACTLKQIALDSGIPIPSHHATLLIKDMARASGQPVDTVPWAFFEKYGSIVVGQAKLLSPRKLEQAEFAAACARELVEDMRSRTVKAPQEWDTHLAMRRTSWTIF
jgi:hypothetical protein